MEEAETGLIDCNPELLLLKGLTDPDFYSKFVKKGYVSLLDQKKREYCVSSGRHDSFEFKAILFMRPTIPA